MSFGNNGTRKIENAKQPISNAFEEIAKEYDISQEKPETKEEKKPKEPVAKKETIKEAPEIEAEESKTEKKATKKTTKKAPVAYYKNYYNLRIDLPKQAEPLLELAAQVYGSKKDYILKLIQDDMREHAAEYREQVKNKPSDEWDF